MNESERDIFAEFERFTGKLPIEEIGRRLERAGLLDREEIAREAVNNWIRKRIGQHRTLTLKTGNIGLQLANLFEIDEEGHEQRYYKPLRELTVDEAVQHIAYWNGKVGEASRQRDLYREYHLKRHGRKLQRRLAFLDDAEGVPA